MAHLCKRSIEEQLPAAQDHAVNDGHPEKQASVTVEGTDGLDVVSVKSGEHKVFQVTVTSKVTVIFFYTIPVTREDFFGKRVAVTTWASSLSA